MRTRWSKIRALPAWRKRSPGQSIPLIALMIVVLIGMVGLSVDVGNTYAENRNAERAANAAAVAGMQRYLETEGWQDPEVKRSVDAAIEQNGFNPVPFGTANMQPNDLEVEAYYLRRTGENVLCGENGRVGTCVGRVFDAFYIRVVTRGQVETYFARALGQDQLPVNSQSYAGKCPPINGMLPITVKHSLVDGGAERFVDADGRALFADIDPAKTLYFKRVYFANPYDVGINEGGYLRWMDDYNNAARDLPLMMGEREGEGTLKYGFNEVTPWPGNPADEFSTYPAEPEYLTERDWAYAFANYTDGATPRPMMDYIQDELNFHMANRNRVFLPLYGSIPVADGSGGYYYNIEQFGEFYILDYDVNGTPYPWIEMIFNGYAPRVPCPAENVTQEDRYGLSGAISLTPRWGEKKDEPEPAGYTIMLDVSGSMSWSFRGWAEYDGLIYQCESYDPDPAYADIPYAYALEAMGEGPFPGGGGDCKGGPLAFWAPPGSGESITERRAYQARDALLQIVREMDVKDRIRVVAFSSNVEATSDQWYAQANAELEQHILTTGECCSGNAGTPPGEPTFLTDGGTSGSAAMNQARRFLNENFPEDPETGKALKPVAIYMTDGVSNVLLDGTRPARKRECKDLAQGEFINTAACNIGYNEKGEEMPITEMQRISREMHADMGDNFEFYVLAMGRMDITGLDRVSTHPSMTYAAREASEVTRFLEEIRAEVQYGECQPRKGDDVTFIREENKPTLDPGLFRDKDIARWGAENIFGYASIYNPGETVAILHIPIIQDRQGRLEYYLDPDDPEDALPPGNYDMTFWVGYNASGREPGADNTYLYNYLINADTGERIDRMSITIDPDATLGPIANGPEILLDLPIDADVCEPALDS